MNEAKYHAPLQNIRDKHPEEIHLKPSSVFSVLSDLDTELGNLHDALNVLGDTLSPVLRLAHDLASPDPRAEPACGTRGTGPCHGDTRSPVEDRLLAATTAVRNSFDVVQGLLRRVAL